MQQMTKEQLNRLEEVAQKAASRASQALAKLIGMPVELEMLRARMIAVDKLASLLAPPEAQMAAVILPVSAPAGGSSVLTATLGESRRLAEILTKRAIAPGESLDNSAVSALKESGNIIGGVFLSTLSDVVGISLTQSVPEFVTDALQAVIAATVAKLPTGDKTQKIAFAIDFALRATTTTTTTTVTIITTTTETIVTHYLFILPPAVAQKLLEALGR